MYYINPYGVCNGYEIFPSHILCHSSFVSPSLSLSRSPTRNPLVGGMEPFLASSPPQQYSLNSKTYRTQGGKDPPFRELARVLLEYGFVHSRPPTIPTYRTGYVITAYEGLKVDWTTIIADCLKSSIASLVDGKKSWTGLSQSLAIKSQKRGGPETTPKKPTERQKLLAKHTP